MRDTDAVTTVNGCNRIIESGIALYFDTMRDFTCICAEIDSRPYGFRYRQYHQMQMPRTVATVSAQRYRIVTASMIGVVHPAVTLILAYRRGVIDMNRVMLYQVQLIDGVILPYFGRQRIVIIAVCGQSLAAPSVRTAAAEMRRVVEMPFGHES